MPSSKEVNVLTVRTIIIIVSFCSIENPVTSLLNQLHFPNYNKTCEPDPPTMLKEALT